MDLKSILFVTERYCDAQETKGETNHFHNLFATAQQSGLFSSIENLFLDQCNINVSLFEKVDRKKPSLIFFSFLGDSPLNPQDHVLQYLQSEDVPLVFLWPDVTYEWALHRINRVNEYATCHVLWDGHAL
jgi:hypothetical protein